MDIPSSSFFFLEDPPDGKKVVDLGFLPGYYSAIANGLNNNGQAVGLSYTPSFQTRATLWVLK